MHLRQCNRPSRLNFYSRTQFNAQAMIFFVPSIYCKFLSVANLSIFSISKPQMFPLLWSTRRFLSSISQLFFKYLSLLLLAAFIISNYPRGVFFFQFSSCSSACDGSREIALMPVHVLVAVGYVQEEILLVVFLKKMN